MEEAQKQEPSEKAPEFTTDQASGNAGTEKPSVAPDRPESDEPPSEDGQPRD